MRLFNVNDIRVFWSENEKIKEQFKNFDGNYSGAGLIILRAQFSAGKNFQTIKFCEKFEKCKHTEVLLEIDPNASF